MARKILGIDTCPHCGSEKVAVQNTRLETDDNVGADHPKWFTCVDTVCNSCHRLATVTMFPTELYLYTEKEEFLDTPIPLNKG